MFHPVWGKILEGEQPLPSLMPVQKQGNARPGEFEKGLGVSRRPGHRSKGRYMSYSISKIHLSAEQQNDEAIDYKNTNTDVIVELTNGEAYAASFFTYDNLREVIRKNKLEGTCLHGKYFWVESMVFVEDCSREIIWEIVNDLIEEGDFELAFQKL